MKTIKNLTDKELKEINGGAADSRSEGGLSLDLGIENLLSFESESRDGDEHQKSSFSAGNGIDLGGIGMGKNWND